MTESLIYRKAVEFEDLLTENLPYSKGVQVMLESFRPIIMAAKSGDLSVPIENAPSFDKVIAEGYIEIPPKVEDLYSEFSLLLELGEDRYLAAIEQTNSILDK